MSKQAIDLIEQQQQIQERGWEAFVAAYERENPPPVQQARWIQTGIGIGLVAALVLSGLLTIPAFQKVLAAANMSVDVQTVGGVAGFLAIDFVMFVASYYVISTQWRLRANSEEAFERFGDITKLMTWAAGFAFLVSVTSNVYFVFIGYEVVTLDTLPGRVFSFVVALLLALAPPVQSVATGSILALFRQSRRCWQG